MSPELLDDPRQLHGKRIGDAEGAPGYDARIPRVIHIQRSRAWRVYEASPQPVPVHRTDPVARRSSYPLSDLAGVHDQQHLVVALELTRARGQLLGHPDIVLVAPGNQIAPREATGLQEVLGKPESFGIAHDTHVKRCA